MSYIDPKVVASPKAQWKLIDVLYNGGDDEDALAIGEWEGERRLAARWNGSEQYSGIGNPQSRGLPTWFMLPKWTYAGILSSQTIPSAKLALAKALLELK